MKQCILCGKLHNKLSKEHIVPRWLQKYFNLNNQKLRLSNGTSIRYNQAVPPRAILVTQKYLAVLRKEFEKTLLRQWITIFGH